MDEHHKYPRLPLDMDLNHNAASSVLRSSLFFNNYIIFYLLFGHPRGYFPRCFTLKFCMYYLSPHLL